jgi:hypothetical protein
MAQRCTSVSSAYLRSCSSQRQRKTGFIAFTTIGYGDLVPDTAIGRSIFVFWALFGVGAMTILIAGMSSELRLPHSWRFNSFQLSPMPSLPSIAASLRTRALITLSVDIVRVSIERHGGTQATSRATEDPQLWYRLSRPTWPEFRQESMGSRTMHRNRR